MKGYLIVNTQTAGSSLPVANAKVEIKDDSGKVLHRLISDENGVSEKVELDAPNPAISLDSVRQMPTLDNPHPAYSVYNVTATAEGMAAVIVNNVTVMAGETSILTLMMHPEDAEVEIIDIPPNGLLLPAGYFTNPGVGEDETIAVVVSGPVLPAVQNDPPIFPTVRPVYIPDYITVHLGTPQDTSARNVRVPFIEYVANVASSEIYPTWPYNSLMANMHAIVTFAINRVYTEWYRSRNFPFDITNSTSYDQFFVYGRNIFENLLRMASDVFNVYAKRYAFHNPYFTEYCNGTTVTCRGLSQWGTVTLANQGKNPLQILRYYYPDDLILVGTDNIKGIQEIYPGTPFRLGHSGPLVHKMQVYLNRIRVNYPLIPAIPLPYGVFNTATDAAVRTFQRTFNLTADGIIGRATWNKISFVYFGIIKVAELNGEGERIGIGQNPPNVVLRQGSRGGDVIELQFILNSIAAYYSSIPELVQDGVFGAGTTNAVIQFQKTFGLTMDGVVGPGTWAKLYSVYNSLKNVPTPPEAPPPAGTRPPYPGTLLRVGDSGPNVKTMQTFLNTIRTVYTAIQPPLVADGIFGINTKSAVTTFQQAFLLNPDGIIGPITWNKIVEMYNRVTGGV